MPDVKKDHDPRYKTVGIAWPSLILSLIFIFGAPLNFFLVATDFYQWYWGLFIGICLYNSAFTIWHEAAHFNIFEKRQPNNFIGWLSSIVNIFPAFFRQRHDHLLHHRHLLDIEYDRTVYRARGPIWFLPFRILDEMKTYGPYNLSYGLKHSKELFYDRLHYILMLAILVSIVLSQTYMAFLICCLLPRLIILPIHVTYVCYLPHIGLPKDRQRGTRILSVGPLKYLIYFHNYHAVHHLWPNIPWYLYPAFYKKNFVYLKEYGVDQPVAVYKAPIYGDDESWGTGHGAPRA